MMPVVTFKGTKIAEEKRDRIAERAYRALVNTLRIPHIELFFDEYDAVYSCGKKQIAFACTDCVIEGPELEAERFSALTSELMGIFRDVLEQPDFGLTAVYHVNDGAHVSLNGKTLEQRRAEAGEMQK